MAEKFVAYRTEGSVALKCSSNPSHHEASIISFPYIQHSRAYQTSNSHYRNHHKQGIKTRLMADPLFGSMKAVRNTEDKLSRTEYKILKRYLAATFVGALALVLIGA